MKKGLYTLSMLMMSVGVHAKSLTFKPYAGLDLSHAWMKARSSWSEVFAKAYVGPRVWLGARLDPHWAVEAGYETTTRQKKNWHLPASTYFFNSQTEVKGATHVRRYGMQVDFLRFFPIEPELELFVSGGMEHIRTRFKVALDPAFNTGALASALNSATTKGRTLLRVGVGGHYKITENAGIRAKIGFENTASVRAEGNEALAKLGGEGKIFKDSLVSSIGAFMKF